MYESQSHLTVGNPDTYDDESLPWSKSLSFLNDPDFDAGRALVGVKITFMRMFISYTKWYSVVWCKKRHTTFL